MSAAASPSTTSVAKAFELLEYLAGAEKPLSLQDLVEGVHLSKPTACRLLRVLQDLGYVSRPTGSRNYLVGPRTARLAASDPHAALKTLAAPLLKMLHKKFNEATNLATLSGQRVLYLEILETSQALRFTLTEGGSDPYHHTALGRAMAARLPESQWQQLLSETTIKPLTSHTVKTHRDLHARILKARRLGYAEEIEESVDGVACLATNLAALGFPAAAISIAVPVQRLTPKRKAAIIRALKSLSQS